MSTTIATKTDLQILRQELPPERMDALIEGIGRRAVHRTTLYGTPTEERVAAGYEAAPLEVLRFQSAREYRAGG